MHPRRIDLEHGGSSRHASAGLRFRVEAPSSFTFKRSLGFIQARFRVDTRQV